MTEMGEFGPGQDWDARAHVRLLRTNGGASSGYTADLIERLYTELIAAALASRPSQGGEWVMVPREPTEEMLAAGAMRTGEQYRAMLSASPSPYGVEELVERLREEANKPYDARPHSDIARKATLLCEAATVIQTLQRERDELVGERDVALREAQDKDIRYRTWREFYGALLAVPASSATPLEVRAHRQANIITDMQYRIKCLRQEIRRHIRRDHLDPPMKGYRIGQHVNKLHKLWREAEARAEAAEQQVRDMREGLEPFARVGDIFELRAGNRPNSDDDPVTEWEDHRVGARRLTVGDFRRARLLLKEGGE